MSMRANSLRFLIVGALISASSAASAQGLPPPSANTGQGSGMPTNSPPPAEAPPLIPTTGDVLPPPVAGGPSGAEASNGAAAPAAAAAPAPKPSDWHFSWRGFLRAPLRIGVGHRPQCPPGTAAATTNTATSSNGVAYGAQYCALNGQSRTTYHSPYVPDDQYLSWTFDRQWEQAWAEMFLSYGNDKVTGTVSVQGYDFTDVSLLGSISNPAQFGIGQGWVAITPDVPIDGMRALFRVGAFWEKFGMAGKYDGGHYDTYMFGRTHTMGESLALEYDVGDVTLKAEHGFGAHLEMVPAGITGSGSASALGYYNSAAMNSYPPGGTPGFTLLDHVHIGLDWKKKIQVNAHYMLAWSNDDRIQGTLTTNGNSAGPDGSMAVYGGEARFLGGVFGELYVAYSHIDAKNVTMVGPAIEVVHSSGGGGHNAANGIYENFFNASGNGDGKIENFQVGYDFSFGYLWRKLQHANATFWGDGPDLRLSLFMMYSMVSADPTSTDPYVNPMANPASNPMSPNIRTDGTKKLKYGADLVASLLPWLGVGVRGDYVQPDSHDTSTSFGVISPKLIIRSKFVTHEEITAQYSHYFNGADVLPQQFLSQVGVKNIGQTFTSTSNYPNDENVFGIKATMWW
jgi:hypothetical protein